MTSIAIRPINPASSPIDFPGQQKRSLKRKRRTERAISSPEIKRRYTLHTLHKLHPVAMIAKLTGRS